MLENLIREKMKEDGLSLRAFSRGAGANHSTVNKILNGGSVDVPILIKISDYLGVSPSTLLDTMGADGLAAKVSALLEAEPRLRELFTQLVQDFENGEVSQSDVSDIIKYAAFKLQS